MKQILLFLLSVGCAFAQLAPNQKFVLGVASDAAGIGTYTMYPITSNSILGFNSSQGMYAVSASAFDVNGAAATAQAYAIQRANQTGSQLANTISDLSTVLSGYATTSALTSGLAGKFPNPTGTTLQYIRGEGSLASFPTSISTFSNDVPYATSAALTAGLAAKFAVPVGSTAQYLRGDGTVANSSAFATASQGSKADSALQSYTETDPIAGAALATHAALTNTAHGGIATTAQGVKADSAVQSGNAPLSASGTAMSIAAATSGAAGSMSAADKTKLDAFPAYVARSFTNNASRTIQTVAAAGNGWQLSASRDSLASYSVTISTTTTIGGPAAGYVVLEVCATNSATAANWQEVARASNSQTATVALALQLITVNGSTVVGMVPAGYYVRLRSVSSSGSPSFAYLSGQEVLF